MSLLTQMQSAMEKVVWLINETGTTCIYTPKDSGVPQSIKIYIREMGSEELVGDYRQGDLRIETDASQLALAPKKYDLLVIDGKNYAIKDPTGSPRRVGDIIYTYKFVVRGG